MNQFKTSIIELVQQKVWGIIPSYLDTIHDILYSHYFGNKIDIGKVEIELGRELDNKFEITVHPVSATKNDNKIAENHTIRDYQIAVIPMHGIITKRMNLFHAISGGTSTEFLKKAIEDSLNNPEIDAIVLDVESPGGTVDGTKELADYIYQSRGKKPILAHANGHMASAAMWIGSATDYITAYDTAHIGSIGVILAHYDYSKRDEMQGLKRTYIYAGKYKTMGNDTEPLSKEAKDYFQKQVDDIYTMFVNDLARNRDKSVNHVLTKMADGKIFFAREACDIGLIDNILNLEQTIELAAKMAGGENMEIEEKEIRKAAYALNNDPIIRIEKISYEEVLQSNPEYSGCCD